MDFHGVLAQPDAADVVNIYLLRVAKTQAEKTEEVVDRWEHPATERFYGMRRTAMAEGERRTEGCI